MTIKKVAILTKSIAIAQAIVAPGLMVIGYTMHKPILTKVGAVWCGLIALDTGRTTCVYVNTVVKNSGIDDDITN